MATNFREPLTKEERQQHTAYLGDNEPAVYCGTYAKYNDGNLFGQWIAIDSFDTYEEFNEYCLRLHCTEEDPELMMQDYECYPQSWYYESGLSAETFERIKAYAGLDEDRRDAYEAYLDNLNSEATIEEFEEHYNGKWDSPADFAEDLYSQCYQIPDYLQGFIDWQAVWRNLDTGGDYAEYDGYIFSR